MKSNKAELKKITKLLQRVESDREQYLKYADHVVKHLNKVSHDNTNSMSEFLAKICAKGDKRFGPFSPLMLEWMLDYYMAMRFEDHYQQLRQVYTYLKEHNYHQYKPLDYFNDCEAFYIPHDNYKICVMGKSYWDRSRYLVIDVGARILGEFHQVHVRDIWRRRIRGIYKDKKSTLTSYREKNFELEYGDGRDVGYVLSYEKMLGKSKVDKVIWQSPSAINMFLFEVNTLHNQIFNIEDDKDEG